MRFIKANEKKWLVGELENFGVKKIPYLLLETGKEKIRGFSGTLAKEQIQKLQELARVEIIGLYLFKREKFGLRFSLDGSMAFELDGVEISDAEVEKWMRGEDLETDLENGIYVVKNKGDVLGCGKSNGEKLSGFIPKERRIRKS